MKTRILSFCLAASVLIGCNKDDDHVDPNPTNISVNNLTFSKIGTITNGTGDEGYAEISAYDPISKKLFIVNPKQTEISVWNMTNPSAPIAQSAISLPGAPNSVAVHNGVLAIAVENTNKQANGQVITYNTSNLQQLKAYTAGPLPDMVTFTPDGKYILAANEGEPNDAYTVDPEGSISLINTQTHQATNLGFNGFNGQTISNNFRVFGPNANLAKDVEPEYIAVSDDSKFAYVALQENNGMAVVNLTTKTIPNLYGLGVKNHMDAYNSLDASNKDNIKGNFKNWPVWGMYQPDAITYVNINNTGYIISANEGDARDYDGYSEEKRVKDLNLDPTAFPNAAELQKQENLGRLKITTAQGDTDNDGDFDKLYCYGGRSFSIWSTTGNLVYDSGNQIGKRTFELNPSHFNADDGEADGRSDDKGAEPEAVTTLKIGNHTLLFVGLERSGGILVYDITNPTAPTFLRWIFDASDIAPEGLITIPANESPNGKPLLVVTHEVSNTVAIYEIK